MCSGSSADRGTGGEQSAARFYVPTEKDRRSVGHSVTLARAPCSLPEAPPTGQCLADSNRAASSLGAPSRCRLRGPRAYALERIRRSPRAPRFRRTARSRPVVGTSQRGRVCPEGEAADKRSRLASVPARCPERAQACFRPIQWACRELRPSHADPSYQSTALRHRCHVRRRSRRGVVDSGRIALVAP